MSVFGKPPPDSQNLASSLRLPAAKRIALPASERLSVITEGVPQASDSRLSRFSWLRNSVSSDATGRTPPPAYDWIPEPTDRSNRVEPPDVEGEKLARLRRSWSDVASKRGGWKRLALLVMICLIIIGLAIGLGVGLTAGKSSSIDNDDETNSNTQTTDNALPIQELPLGQYSFLTTLTTQKTDCTANSATWRCYPYSIFDPSNPSTLTTSQTTFDWIIRNTSTTYATNATTTSDIPANLTLSSTKNPFALAFADQPLTYLSTASNTTSPRLTFSFSLPKTVVPSSAITSNNAASQCFFNNTTLAGTIYLSAPHSEQSGTGVTDSNEVWPFAVEITQSSPSGDATPDCYETIDGRLGGRIVQGLEPEEDGKECICGYKNF
ncbi:hypothetical protein Q7P37_004043 [Cladosporium fusiforme]